MPLRDIAGQPVAIQCLGALVRNRRVPHAMLFHGPDGCGKRTAALAFAQAVNCPSPIDGDGCGVCPTCERIARGIDVDVRYFAPTRNEFRREQAFEVREEAFISPNTGVKKFLILDAAHNITAEAANLLLKVLEEPPETTVFILLTDNPHLILPTINSRTIHMPFRPLTQQESAKILEGRVDPEAIPLLYAISGGNAGRILKLATETDLGALYRDIRQFLESELLKPGRTSSPTSVAEKILVISERIDLGTIDDTEASKMRKGVVSVLETMLSLMETRLAETFTAPAGRAKQTKAATVKNPASWCGLMENIIDTIKIISGAGHTLLALENLVMHFRNAAATAAG